MKNIKFPRWRIITKRISGIIEYERIKIKQLRETIVELEKIGQKPSISPIEPLVLEYVLLRDKRLKIKDKIVSVKMEPDI